MRNKIIGIFVCMLLITTCVLPVMGEFFTLKKSSNNTNPLSSGNSTLKFMIAGKELRALRSYWLHVPPSYDGSKPVPLVLNLCYMDQFYFKYPHIEYNLMELITNFSQKADEEGFIVVYPNQKVYLDTGLGPNWYTGKLWPIYLIYGYDCGYYPWWSFKFIDDIGFMQDLIDKMKKDYNINSSRIYATGFSDGAYMSYSIGAYLSDIVTAIAPVEGSIGWRCRLDEPMYYIPTPKNPVSVIAFQGTTSGWFYDGIYLPSVNESISFWVEHNGCDPTPELWMSESGKTKRRTYTNGENGTEVVLYEIIGGGHWWPGSSWDTIQDISTTDLIWEFFEAHPKRSPQKVSIRSPAEFESVDELIVTWPQWQFSRFELQQLQYMIDLIEAAEDAVHIRININNPTVKMRIISKLQKAGVPVENITFTLIQTNSIWFRDYGPLFYRKK